jgi:hypothetical protein
VKRKSRKERKRDKRQSEREAAEESSAVGEQDHLGKPGKSALRVHGSKSKIELYR